MLGREEKEKEVLPKCKQGRKGATVPAAGMTGKRRTGLKGKSKSGLQAGDAPRGEEKCFLLPSPSL